MTKEQALQLWDELFDGNDVAFDYASHEIHKEDYQNDDRGFGWDVDYKQPLTAGGNSSPLNMTISSVLTKAVRGGKPSFRIANFTYEVRKGRRYGSFEIFDVTDKNHPVSMEPNDENQDAFYNAERKRKQLEDTTKKKTNMFKNDFFKNLINPFKNTKVEEKKNENVVEKPIFEAEPVKAEEESEVVDEVVKDENVEEVEDTSEVVDETCKVVEDKNEEVIETEEESEVVDESDSEIALENETNVESSIKEIKDSSNDVFEDEDMGEFYDSDDVIERISKAAKECEEEQTDIEKVEEDKNEEAIVDELNDNKELSTDSISDENHEYDDKTDEIDKGTVVEHAEPLVAVTFEDDENEFVNTDTFKKEEWKNADGKENAISSVSDVNFVSSCKETSDEIKEEVKPEVDSTLKVASTNFDFEKENKEEINPQYQEAEDDVKEPKQPSSDIDEEEISQYIGDDDDETIIIDTDLDEPDENTDISGLLHKIDDLKKLVSYLEKEQGKTKNEMQSLSAAFEKEKKTSSSVNEDNHQLNSQLCTLSVEKTKLEDEIKSLKENIENLKSTISTKDEENKNLKQNLNDLNLKIEKFNQDSEQSKTTIISLNDLKTQNEKKYAEMTQKLSDVSLSLASVQKTNENLEADLVSKDEQIQVLLNEKTSLSDKNIELENTVKEKDENIESLNQVIQNKDDEIEKYLRDELFIKARIDDMYFDECYSYLKINSLPITLENIYLALNKNPQWEKNFAAVVVYKPVEEQKEEDTLEDMSMKAELLEDEDVTYLTEEIDRKVKALQAFKDNFKTESEAIDFAGRFVKYDEYKNENSKNGWDFITLEGDEIVVANLKTLEDFKENEEFQTNGHIFKVVERDGKKKIVSSEYVTDIYDFKQAMEVVEQGSKKQVPLVYIFIKYTGIKKETYDIKNQKKFNDLIERTIQRACPHSFLKLQCNKSYTFITFDPTADDAYKEIHRYSLLLNSYRYAFNKNNWLNAVIVLDKVMIPFNYRNLGFEQISSVANDIDLKAVNYCLNQVNMVDTSIARLVHIGPEIIDDLPLTRANLTESNLGKGNFEVAYTFDRTYYVMKFRFDVGVK